MPPHSTGSGTISFGLVSIPVRMYTATSSESVAFNQIHRKCGGRIKQQILCPTCNEVVDRSDLVKGYEFAKDQYVQFTDEELKALEGETNKMIEIAEFVPLAQVDPIYFEKTYYLGADKGGEKAYRLLKDAMLKSERVALAQITMRGKESLVLIRPAMDGLMMHFMYYADEVRDFADVEKGDTAKIKAGEMDLANRLIDELSKDSFRPDQFADEYRTRVLQAVELKVEGQEVTSLAPQAQKTQVIDLMDALKQSLGKRGSGAEKGEARGAKAAPAKLEKKPAAKARRQKAEAPRERKVQGGRR